MEKLSLSVDALQEAIKANTTAAEKFSVTTPPSTHCFGGFPKQFDFGGRGTDTIPADALPGEMVINAVSARQFSAQLIAMNAGIQPVFRSRADRQRTSVT